MNDDLFNKFKTHICFTLKDMFLLDYLLLADAGGVAIKSMEVISSQRRGFDFVQDFIRLGLRKLLLVATVASVGLVVEVVVVQVSNCCCCCCSTCCCSQTRAENGEMREVEIQLRNDLRTRFNNFQCLSLL